MVTKQEADMAPKPYEITSVTKTNYRSGKQYEVGIRFTWGNITVASKVQYYQEDAILPFDSSTEKLADLKTKAQKALANIKAKPTDEADLIFNLMRLTV